MMSSTALALMALAAMVGATLPPLAQWLITRLGRDQHRKPIHEPEEKRYREPKREPGDEAMGGDNVSAVFVRRESWSVASSLAVALASTTLAGVLLAMHGPSAKALVLMVFVWAMLLLFVTDAKSQLLPDAITMPLLWLGLLVQLWPATRNIALEASMLGAVMGYALLQVIRLAYRRWRSQEGLGYGDVKLMAAVGAWLGPFGVTTSIFLGSLLALTWHGAAALSDRGRLDRLFALGPFLVTGALAALLFGVY